MLDTKRTISKFISKNQEFDKIVVNNKKLHIKLKESCFEYYTADFSLSSVIRQKLNELERSLGLPVV